VSSSKSFLSLLQDATLALFYPRECALCGNSVESYNDGATCAACWKKTRIFKNCESLCNKCGRFLEISLVSDVSINCYRCRDDFYSAARAVGVYEDALRIAVLELKEKPFIAPKLKTLLEQAINHATFAQTTKIVPVPLHFKREKLRGFNQAQILAKFLSLKTNLPLIERALRRELYTKQHRAGMDEQARHDSIVKAFVVKQPNLIRNENILLVDDVFTSGATASICAKALIDAGAQAVFVLTIARAV
jgi:ComF family protein